jgi:hypothetical protein
MKTSYRVHCWLRLKCHKWDTLREYFASSAAQQRCRACGRSRIVQCR